MEEKNESKHAPETKFDLPKLKNQAGLLTRAAEFYIQMHNPHQNLKNEPYRQLVVGASNDFLRMEAAGFYITENAPALLEENKNMQAEISELLAVMHRDGGHYQVKVGTIQAIKDAKELLFTEWQSSDQIESLRAEVDRLKNDLKHSEERADQRLDSYTKMANYATDFKVEVDRLTKEKSEILGVLDEVFKTTSGGWLQEFRDKIESFIWIRTTLKR